MSPARVEGHDIVCFANDWAGDPLSKKHIMRRFARANRVLWVDSLGNRAPRPTGHDLGRVLGKVSRFREGVTEIEPNLWVLSPLAVPAYRSTAARRLNRSLLGWQLRRAMAGLGFRRPLTYSFVPASAWVVGTLGEERVVYHCADEYASFDGGGADIAALERSLIGRADLVVVCSAPLLERKRILHPRTALIRHGVDYAHFARALDPDLAVPADVAGLPRPILGFHGLVAEWIDLELLRKVANRFAGGSLVIVGEIRADARPLAGVANVHVLGHRPYERLPAYCRAFDVALLPFRVNDLTLHSCPLKLREYLAAGLPVVATDIPEAAHLAPWVRVAQTDDEFLARVDEALRDRPGPMPDRSTAVAHETWDHQFGKLEALVAEVLG